MNSSSLLDRPSGQAGIQVGYIVVATKSIEMGLLILDRVPVPVHDTDLKVAMVEIVGCGHGDFFNLGITREKEK